MTDILDTVKAELDELEHDVDCPCHGDITPHSWECANCECYLSKLCALVTRCEQAEADLAAARAKHDAAHANWMTAEQLAANAIEERDAARAEAARLRELAAKLSDQMFSVAGFLRGKDIPEHDRVWQMAFDAKAALEKR